jgi:tetratricopeptide (TPR) repeat protein
MSDNNYSEAAKLFRRIIDIQPTNKAAHIRLQECISRQPELSKDINIAPDSDINAFVKHEDSDMKEDFYQEIKSARVADEFEGMMNEPLDNFSEDIMKLKKPNVKHKHNDEELQKMYEEAIYTMFQNDYIEASKIFQQILRIRPENKAARIRLQECREAISNA